MAKPQHFNIINRIVCEEIRQEKSNKFILLGVFSGDILVEKFPADVPLSLFLEGKVDSQDEGVLHIRFSGPGDGSALMSVHYKPHESGLVALPTPRFTVTMEKPGTFKVELSEDQKTWETVVEKEVILGHDLWALAPIVMQPPS